VVALSIDINDTHSTAEAMFGRVELQVRGESSQYLERSTRRREAGDRCGVGPPSVLCMTFRNFHVHEASASRGTFLAPPVRHVDGVHPERVIRSHALTPDDHAFCAALLEQGDVLFVVLPYLPGCVLWLVSMPRQAWLMREKQPGAIVLTLGEAADLAAILGDPRPYSLWDVAAAFSAPVSFKP